MMVMVMVMAAPRRERGLEYTEDSDGGRVMLVEGKAGRSMRSLLLRTVT